MATVAGRSGSRSRGNTWIALAAVALGLITALLVINYLRTQDSERRTNSEASIPVVVASREIPLGTNITSGMLELKHVTPDLAVANAYPEVAQVIGLRARSTIPEGVQVVRGMVVQSGAGDALSFVVPPGKRAVAITGSNVIGGGGHIRPGDFVDVLVTIEAWRLDGRPAPASAAQTPKGVYTILQGVEVLAVSDEAQKVPDSGPDAAKKNGSQESLDRSDNRSVTLAVDPNQAQLLFLAESEGDIRLALRPFGERDEQPIAPVIEPFMPGGSPRPATR